MKIPGALERFIFNPAINAASSMTRTIAAAISSGIIRIDDERRAPAISGHDETLTMTAAPQLKAHDRKPEPFIKRRKDKDLAKIVKYAAHHR